MSEEFPDFAYYLGVKWTCSPDFTIQDHSHKDLFPSLNIDMC